MLTLGLPELAVCTMTRPLLDLFPYFWPLAQAEIQALEASINVVWTAHLIQAEGDVQQLGLALDRARKALSGPEHTVVLFTLNDFTSYWTAGVVGACRNGRADELVAFKDPTVSPYLCDFPAQQKKFRRPPP